MAARIEVSRPQDLLPILALLEANQLPIRDLARNGSVRFLVARDGDSLAGVIALESFGKTGLLRSLAVPDAQRGRGFGVALTQALEDEARQAGIGRLVLLTETAADFFARLGYERIERGSAPDAVRGSQEFTSLCPATATCMAKILT
jgi:amino-acid N-acetyltransferase